MMPYPTPPRPDAPKPSSDRLTLLVLWTIAAMAINFYVVPGLRRTMPTDPGDASGVAAMSFAFIDAVVVGFWIVALGTRLRRWEWRLRHG